MTIPLWAPVFEYGTLVTSVWLNWVRANLPRAVDGVGGGDYQPLTVIRFGDAGIGLYDNAPMTVESGSTVTWQSGSFLTVANGATVVFGGAVATGAITCTTLNASGMVTCAVGVTVTTGGCVVTAGGLTVSAGGAEIFGNSTITGHLATTGNLDVQGVGQSNIGGVLAVGVGVETAALQVTVDASVGGLSTLVGVTHTGALTRSGVNAVTVERVDAIDPSSANEILSTSFDAYHVTNPSSLVSDYTLKSTSPTPAENTSIEVSIFDLGGINMVQFMREDLSIVVSFAGAGYGHAKFKFIGGAWRLFGADGDATIAYTDP